MLGVIISRRAQVAYVWRIFPRFKGLKLNMAAEKCDSDSASYYCSFGWKLGDMSTKICYLYSFRGRIKH
jgi:hypothetical protein